MSQDLSNWKQGDKLVRNIETKDFVEAVDLINSICTLAEKLNHHPDLHLTSYNNLSVEIYTHDSNEVTNKDFELASQIEILINSK